MAGLYIHIPFCKSRCAYCDFYSGIQLPLMDRLVDALCREIALRADYLKDEPLETIYFGGGTPSLLSQTHFLQIFQTIRQYFEVNPNSEITIEANPDDLNDEKVEMLASLRINRLSIGIQSFDDAELTLLRRRHTANQATEAVERCKKVFANISIDLMYGLPSQTISTWQHTISAALSLNIQHISAYHLTYEEGTLLERKRREGKITPVTEEISVEMFRILREMLHEKGIEQYEISNFALPGYHSRHNSAYWQGIPYLGIGPAAHSFDDDNRQWNVADTVDYIESIEKDSLNFEKEYLTIDDKFNELIMISLRTIKGISLYQVESKFGDVRKALLLKHAARFIETGLLQVVDNYLQLTQDGIFVSDGIIADLMVD